MRLHIWLDRHSNIGLTVTQSKLNDCHAHRVSATFLPLHRAALRLLLGVACAGCDAYYYCDDPSAERIRLAPLQLSETGLYRDTGSRTLAPDVRAFEPQFVLFSDGAQKRRFVRVPAGARIDTSDMDDWRFPVGTKLWKEFRAGEQLLETRLIEKIGEGESDWLAISYVWRPDGSDAIATPHGVENTSGTTLDVPAAGECIACHGGRRSFVLGFSALQLSSPAQNGALDLAQLTAAGLLSDPPDIAFAVPGTDTERAALGYLHANCGHCHNQHRPPRGTARCFDPEKALDFQLRTDQLARPEDTPTYRSAVGVVIEPGDPRTSRLFQLVSARGMFQQMPPLGTERVDAPAVSMLRLWIERMDAP